MLKLTGEAQRKQCQNLHLDQFVLESFQDPRWENVAPVVA